ncbi:Alkylated DNA repair protein alkB homolog 1 [Strongyloides ratti]|uniref:Alkylated DNA repair protein alkB homolog 1 n=1 Tax=Strongyloides ratti TaxID=34506 RepID=A0A090L834_STRRB|nr:Alkylated DNA repair protein alkB homolog 1 [Strongyloides ratti]CEF64258.1 Alkylated DNA repair protein alkB homolog 1 [Strongyloides ratti]
MPCSVVSMQHSTSSFLSKNINDSSLTNKLNKTNNSPPDQYSTSESNVESNKSLIRRLFKYYKNNSMKPDLSTVLDLSVSNIDRGIFCYPVIKKKEYEKYIEYLELTDPINWSCTTIDKRPGFFLIKGLFTKKNQIKWMEKCLLEYPENGAITNLNFNKPSNDTNIFANCGEKLRWVTKGYDYNWSTKEYPRQQTSDFPEEFSLIFELVCLILDLKETKGDTAIINYYPKKATLSVHTDHSERRLDKPLVSLSFGQSAIFLLGGQSEEDNVDPILLSSGDIMVMHGEQRLAYHAVPKIVITTKFEKKEFHEISDNVLEYSNKNRVNITIRQCD